MTGQVEITLLGRFEVRVDGVLVPAEAWRRRHPAALLKLLALAPGRRLHREQVLDALWPDVDPALAAPRLHKAAHFVRRATGRADAVELAADTVALFPGGAVGVDVTTFETLAASGRAGSALAIYGGDLLPADLYEPWLARDRDRLQLLRSRLLREAGRWEELLAVDPADEDAHVALMRRFLEQGRRAAALRQYDRLRLALEEELGVEPGDEAQALRERAASSGATVDLTTWASADSGTPPVLRQHRRRGGSVHRRCRAFR